jgi:hypothetical protein
MRLPWFRINQDAIYQEYLRKFVDNAVNSTNARLNYLYGYPITKVNEMLWILNSKTHPEFETQQQAIEAIKVIFKDAKAENPIDATRENLKPLIAYLESLKDKYATSEKTDKKMRYSAYYNLSKIYYLLDMPDESIKAANDLITNDFDAKDGKDFLTKAEELKAEFKRTNLTSLHGN